MSSCDESEYSITTVASRTAAKTEIIITAFFFMSAKIDGCPQLSNYFNHIVISLANVWQMIESVWQKRIFGEITADFGEKSVEDRLLSE